MSGACDGLRVVDFSTWMAGPLATMVLADYGADVVKVEPPAGDPARSLPAFQTWNRGKRGVVLDLKTDVGRGSVTRLIAEADVVVTSFRPGVAERLGIGYERVQEQNPSAVYAAITGFGEAGSRAGLKGYDALVTAKSGRLMMFERVADRDGPAFPVIPCASYAAAMLTLQGVLAALHRRHATGRGQKVSVSLLASLMPYDMIMWIGWQLRGDEIEAGAQPAPMVLQKLMGERQMIGKEPPEAGTYDPKQLHRPRVRVPRPNYLTAVTRDGVWLQFANTMDHLCLAQMQALDLVDLYGQERFARLPAILTEDDAEALWEIVLERVRSKTYAEWASIFEQQENLAVERVRRPEEALEHRQVVHGGLVIAVPGMDGGPTLQPGPLARLSSCPAAIERRAPKLGEHTEEVLRGLNGTAAAVVPQVTKAAPGGPLQDITIVDFSTWIAAPLSTSILANLGARVIKIEPVGGELSRYSTGGLLSFPMTQGKQSVALDLKSDEGLKIAHDLIVGADAVVHNYRPGVAERLGIDYETFRRLNPRLVYLNAASYGDDGPDAGRPMFFATAAALGGNQMRQVGHGFPRPGAENLPLDELKLEAWRLLKAAEGNADPIAAVGAAAALLLALNARDTTGEGQQILTTMIGSDTYANSDEAIVFEGRLPARAPDEMLYGLGPLYRLYKAADGWVFLACVHREEWSTFCRVIERPDLECRWETAWRDGDAALGLTAAMAAVMRERPADEWERLMAERDVPLVAVEMRDVGRFNIQDEDMRESGHIVQVESAVHGKYWRHGRLVTFSEDGATFGAWEPLGGHTEAVLRELEYTPEQVADLAARKVIEVWSADGG